MKALACALIVISTAVWYGCAKGPDSSSDSTDALQNTAETAVASIGGAADDETGGSFAQNGNGAQNAVDALWARISDSFIKPAWAAVCARPITATCSSGVQTVNFSGCTLGFSAFTLSGTATLTYSQSNCLIASVGDTVTRTMDFTRTGPMGGQLHTSSASHSAWDGSTISGGQVLTRAGAGSFALDVHGVHKVFTTSNGRTLYDHSIKTTSSVLVAGALTRASRQVTNGSVSVYHNLAKYIAAYTVTHTLTYSALCCFPTGGTIRADLSGSLTGTASVTFGSTCGEATLTQNGTDTKFTMHYCE
jgi:hypothetical protein